MELKLTKSLKFGTDSSKEMVPSQNIDFCHPLAADVRTIRPKMLAKVAGKLHASFL